MAAHAYWRVYITANSGDHDYTSVQEIEMRATSGGADQTTGGTAIASDYSGASVPAGAFDDDVTEYHHVWVSDGSAGDHWIGYHFTAAVGITELVIWAQNYTGGPARAPKDFALEYSDDGVTWTAQKQFAAITGWVAGQSKVFVIGAEYSVSGTVKVGGVAAARRVSLYTRPAGVVATPVFLDQAMSDPETGAYQIGLYLLSTVGVMGVADDDYGTAWASYTAYAADDLTYPLTPNGHYYKCTTAGTSGGAEPSWSGSTVSDGTISWADQGTMRAPEVQGPYIPVLVL